MNAQDVVAGRQLGRVPHARRRVSVANCVGYLIKEFCDRAAVDRDAALFCVK